MFSKMRQVRRKIWRELDAVGIDGVQNVSLAAGVQLARRSRAALPSSTSAAKRRRSSGSASGALGTGR